MGTASHRAFVTASMFLLLACAESGFLGEGVTVTDSLGIPVVFSAQPAWDLEDAWSLSENPKLSIGAVEGDEPYLFFRVAGAFLLPDGGLIVVHSSRPPILRIYDRAGKHLRSIGGEGEGPGEFRNLQNAWLDNDGTLIAYDPNLGRVYRFTVAGELVDTRPVKQVQTYATMGRRDWPPRWFDRFGDGSLLGRPGRPVPYESGRSRPLIAFTHLDLATLKYDTVALARGVEYSVDDVERGYFANVAAVVFGAQSVAVAHHTTAFISDTKDFWIEEIAPGGRVLRRFGRAYDPEPVTPQVIEEYWAPRRARAQTDFERRDLEAYTRHAAFADTLPAHDIRMKVDSEGNLWVRLRSEDAVGDKMWSVFDQAGVWLGDVRTPRRLRITEIVADAALGVWSDDLDVLSVRVYGLEKPNG